MSGMPATNLSNPSILNPLAYPLQTTEYDLLVYDTLGCPKPGISRVIVNVNPQIIAFAGNDTSIVVNQPLHLHGSGAPSFLWFPDFGLDRNDIQDPVAMLSQNQTYVMKTFTEDGCFAYDTVNIKVFTTAPDIFVPNAFTPGNNDQIIFSDPSPWAFPTLNFSGSITGMVCCCTIRAISEADGMDTITVNSNLSAVMSGWFRERITQAKRVSKKGTVVLIR